MEQFLILFPLSTHIIIHQFVLWLVNGEHKVGDDRASAITHNVRLVQCTADHISDFIQNTKLTVWILGGPAP